MKLIERYPKSVLLILMLGFIFTFYGKVLLSPNSYLLSSSGDGIKNYFTYATQLNQTNWTSTQAMNYPYGEHFLYLDCQPVFTVMLKGIITVLPFLKPYSIGILNLLLLGAIGITAWFVFGILRLYKLNTLYSILGAFSIAIMAPQIGRITGHLALGYGFFIPLTWYLYLRYKKSAKQLKWVLFLALNGLFWFFIHAYLGMIITTFLSAVFCFEFLLSKSSRYWKRVGHFVLFTMLPFLFFWSYAKFSDTHFGRTSNPYGFFESTSNFTAVFLPNYGPVKTMLNYKPVWEGMSYVGLSFMLAILVALVLYSLGRASTKTRYKEVYEYRNQLIATFFAGSLVLFIAFGYPFNWKPGLLDRFEIIKNFRGIGRFAWVFYFTFTVSAFIFLVKTLEQFRKGFTYFAVLLIACLSFFEALPLHRFMNKHLGEAKNMFSLAHADSTWVNALNHINTSDYQAIIPLPYFQIGSENFGKEGTEKSYQLAFFFGYHTKLPLIATYATRTSLWEARSEMQLFTPNYYPKTIKKYLHDKRSFLIVYSKESLNQSEIQLVRKGEKLLETSDFIIYQISWNALFKNESVSIQQQFNKQRFFSRKENGYYIFPGSIKSYWFANSFDSLSSSIRHSGSGALSTPKNGYTVLKEFAPGELKSYTSYQASFWIYHDGSNFGQDIPNGICFYEGVSSAGKKEWMNLVNMSSTMTIDGSWSLIEIPFTAGNADSISSIVINGKDNKGRKWIVDDLLIRNDSITLYRKYPRSLMWNNHWIRK